MSIEEVVWMVSSIVMILLKQLCVTKDYTIFESLVVPSVYDATILRKLEVLFNAFST